MDEVSVIDGLFPDELYDEIVNVTFDKHLPWTYSRTDDGGMNFYLTHQCFGTRYAVDGNDVEGNDWSNQAFKMGWEVFQNNFQLPESASLNSCYLNGMPQGTFGFPHVDAMPPNKMTTVITYICPRWSSWWGGETVIIDGDFTRLDTTDAAFDADVTEAVMPKRNRALIFDSTLMHSARPVTSKSPMRVTMMYKILGCSPDEIAIKDVVQSEE